MPQTATLAADLVPWWFATAFWLALVVLVAMVARDVRRMGGPRRVISAVREAIDRFGDDDALDEARDGDQSRPDH